MDKVGLSDKNGLENMQRKAARCHDAASGFSWIQYSRKLARPSGIELLTSTLPVLRSPS
ncbi:hypothetical protein [Halomonas binhaiensis]|uniref:Uncharacterized protein n=1 Tax=Halomonas binhaiensis TaxID=2562282 RepID=A0A7U3HWP8_9GAMM|nr:hypothetical protein [Halomonas binhaiensis]QRG26781.1 hypothetical protein E4T21_21525 [Halomonas binhaiensis]